MNESRSSSEIGKRFGVEGSAVDKAKTEVGSDTHLNDLEGDCTVKQDVNYAKLRKFEKGSGPMSRIVAFKV